MAVCTLHLESLVLVPVTGDVVSQVSNKTGSLCSWYFIVVLNVNNMLLPACSLAVKGRGVSVSSVSTKGPGDSRTSNSASTGLAAISFANPFPGWSVPTPRWLCCIED